MNRLEGELIKIARRVEVKRPDSYYRKYLKNAKKIQKNERKIAFLRANAVYENDHYSKIDLLMLEDEIFETENKNIQEEAFYEREKCIETLLTNPDSAEMVQTQLIELGIEPLGSMDEFKIVANFMKYAEITDFDLLCDSLEEDSDLEDYHKLYKKGIESGVTMEYLRNYATIMKVLQENGEVGLVHLKGLNDFFDNTYFSYYCSMLARLRLFIGDLTTPLIVSMTSKENPYVNLNKAELFASLCYPQVYLVKNEESGEIHLNDPEQVVQIIKSMTEQAEKGGKPVDTYLEKKLSTYIVPAENVAKSKKLTNF